MFDSKNLDDKMLKVWSEFNINDDETINSLMVLFKISKEKVIDLIKTANDISRTKCP